MNRIADFLILLILGCGFLCLGIVIGQRAGIVARVEIPETPPLEVHDLDVPEIVYADPGDSYWSLAEHYLGDGRRWKELAELNLAEPPYTLRVGQPVRIRR